MKLFLTGGFLGSGKTTAIQKACAELTRNEVKVAVVTNDQGDQLVDSGYLKSFGFPVTEVTNGCFCCNYEQLAEKITCLSEKEQPEIIFAESVGSCTDLVATIAKPLKNIFPQTAVSISVFADAYLLLSLINGRSSFIREELRYIYKKQLEEADILIINKVDLLNEDEVEHLRQFIKSEYAHKTVLFQNSFDPGCIRQWLVMLNNFKLYKQRSSLQLDYDIYAIGEAMLAWFDGELIIESVSDDAFEIGMQLIELIHRRVKDQDRLIGHLKFLIDDGANKKKISFTGSPPAAISQDHVKTSRVAILINARIQAEPEMLESIVTTSIKELMNSSGSKIIIKSQSCFQPGYPKPTHRIAD